MVKLYVLTCIYHNSMRKIANVRKLRNLGCMKNGPKHSKFEEALQDFGASILKGADDDVEV